MRVKILNMKKYKTMLKAAMLLKITIAEDAVEFEATVDVIESFNAGVVSAELDEMTIYHPKRFASIISMADNVEIYPLINGKIQLTLTYQDVLATIA